MKKESLFHFFLLFLVRHDKNKECQLPSNFLCIYLYESFGFSTVHKQEKSWGSKDVNTKNKIMNAHWCTQNSQTRTYEGKHIINILVSSWVHHWPLWKSIHLSTWVVVVVVVVGVVFVQRVYRPWWSQTETGNLFRVDFTQLKTFKRMENLLWSLLRAHLSHFQVVVT